MHFDAITYSLLKDRKLRNVAPLCTITTSDWTGSTSGEVLFTGDGTTKDFSGKVDLPPVNPLDSFVLHYTIGGTTYDATADESGNITGEHITSGTINQDGNYEIHFDTPPDNGTDGTADYDYGIPPSNLENVLDPSNPNPSSWGWTSTTGSSSFGYTKIKPQHKGIYLITAKIEYYNVNGTASLQVVWQELWGSITPIIQTVITYKKHTSPFLYITLPVYCRVDDDLQGGQFTFSTNGSDEFKIRFHNIEVFKIL